MTSSLSLDGAPPSTPCVQPTLASADAPRPAPSASPQSARAPVVRMCAACRERVDARYLLRLTQAGVAVEAPEALDAIQIDWGRTRGGRGLHLGPSPLCLARAAQRGVFQRQWRLPVSRTDAEVLAVRAREAARVACQALLTEGWRRGGLVAVTDVNGVEPESARILWENELFCEWVGEVPPVRAVDAAVWQRLDALARIASEFTFTRVGAIKRRPEAAERCETLERCGGYVVRGVGMSGGSKRTAETRETPGGTGTKHLGPDGRNG